MAVHSTIEELTVESVSEFLESAGILIEKRKPDGGIMGYSATLLLFCVIDAIGHHLKVGSGNTRLEVLNLPAFGLDLNEDQIKKTKKWFRNSLVHNASIVPGVELSPEDQGDVFEFDNGKPKKIRVRKLYELVFKVWKEHDRNNFDPLRDTLQSISADLPPRNRFATSTFSPGASGMNNLPAFQSSATPPPSGGVIARPKK
jgi:hypothetical protein